MKPKLTPFTLAMITLLIGSLLGIQASHASAKQKIVSSETPIPAPMSQEVFDLFAKLISTWESNFTKPGWIRLNYVEKKPTASILTDSPEAKYPANALVEIWFHYNADQLVDQEIDFLGMDGQKMLSAIIYRGAYRGLSEKFVPQKQESYAPSLTFYLTAVSPALAAKEGIQMDISINNRGLDQEEITQFNLTQVFPNETSRKWGYGENIAGIQNTVIVDPKTGAILGIENYLLDTNLETLLTHEISQVKVDAFASLPADIQWYFDHYDQLNWESYFDEFQRQK
jgi:hypothetical protein